MATDLQRHDLSVPGREVVQPVTGRNFYAPAGVSLRAAVTVFPEEYVEPQQLDR